VVQLALQLQHDLENLNYGLDALEQEALQAAEDYTLAKARAELAAGGATVAARDAEVMLATHAERIRAKTAEILVRGRKRQIDTLGIRIGVVRTAAATLRAEQDYNRIR
jgi:hypothetical protein